MNYENMTKDQLLNELAKLRQENMELKLAQKDQERISITPDLPSPNRWFSTGRTEVCFPIRSKQQTAVNHPIKYRFSDLVDIPFLQRLLNSFYAATGISHSLLDNDNNILSSAGWQDICTQFHRVCPQTECRCKQSDSYIAIHLYEGHYIGYECLNGLMDFAVPIIIEGQHLATIFKGQLLHEPPDEDFFRRQAQEYGFDEEVYMEALRRVPIIPEEQIESIMGFYSQLGQFLATTGLERKRQLEAADAALHLSEQKFYKAFQCNPDLMAISTLDEGRFIEVNDAFVKTTGYERHEVIGRTAHELGLWVVPEERDIMARQLLESGSIRNYEADQRIKSGEIRNFSGSGEIIDINDKPHLLVTNRDITESKRMLEALRFSEECFSKAFNANQVLMAIASLKEGRIIKVNNAFCRNMDYSREELIGRTVLEINFWADIASYHRVMQSLSEKKFIQDMEMGFHKKTGEERLGLFTAEHLDVDGEPCILGILTDITELRQMELEMTRLDRLNLVGEMAASIGHEIRNPMTTVRGYLQLLRENKDYAQGVECFDLMIEELDRANLIITEFLSLAKNKMVELKPKNLNSIINRSLPLIQAKAISQDHYIELELDKLPNLLLDEKEIRQLILNLVNNGLESMVESGYVIIKTFIEKETLVLAVRDQGHGIDRELLEKLGTPFFTTKDQGTGLGLAVCYRIANRHNAKIDIETASTGTTFYVRFPIPLDSAAVNCLNERIY